MNWKDKKVLVTGAGGFIGSHLTERLVELGAQTRALIHYNSENSWGWLDESPLKSNMEVFSGDIRDPESLKLAMKDVNLVFHLAALIAIPYSYQTPVSYVRTNVEGTLNVLQVARESGAELVLHTSTSEVYGTARMVPINESHPLQGQSPYSASKIGADKIAESFYHSFGLPIVTLRPFNTFGPRQSARAVIPTIMTQCLTSSKITLGNLKPTRDLNYVGNTVDGYICAAKRSNAVGKTINLGSGQEISVGDLAHLIAKLCGKKIEITQQEERLRPENSEVNRLLADNSLAKELLDWTPKTGIKEGLSLGIEWMRRHLHKYKVGTYTV